MGEVEEVSPLLILEKEYQKVDCLPHNFFLKNAFLGGRSGTQSGRSEKIYLWEKFCYFFWWGM